MTATTGETKCRVAVVGATGYVGAEFLRYAEVHPCIEVSHVVARRQLGQAVADIWPHLSGLGGLRLSALNVAEIADCADIIFCALPHGQSAEVVGAFYDAGCVVIDASADFRLRDARVYQSWYDDHPRPDLLAHAVYGLPELVDGLCGARLIAGPGCYPTSALLPLVPLVRAGLIESDGLIIDAKSGTTGAGRGPSFATHFSEMGEGMRAYKVGGRHRHTPEIEQQLGVALGADPPRILFTPQLAPMTRGILACAYAKVVDGISVDDIRSCWDACYGERALVEVLSDGALPDTQIVRGTARAQLAAAVDERTGTAVLISAIDNLGKGAAGQAVQALNIQRGWPEALGLRAAGLFP